MASEPLEQPTDVSDERKRELVSLARLVTYARNSAKDLEIEFTTYCLDLALGSLLQELTTSGLVGTEWADHDDYAPSFVSGVSH